MTARQDYLKHVLEIETEVSVVLARKRMPLEDVLSLTSGSSIPFEKKHDEPLTLEAGGHEFAIGEAIKVGDKFGLRIRELIDAPDLEED